MAAALITVSGTSGTVEIDYLIGGTPYTIQTGIGTLYIESTATAVTYITLSGDAIASSGVLTITAKIMGCYVISWKGITAPGYLANQISIGATNITIPDTSFPNGVIQLASAINSIGNNTVVVKGYNTVVPPGSIDSLSIQYNILLRVQGPDYPILRIRSADNTEYIYIRGTTSTCTPTEYTMVAPCTTVSLS